MTKAQEWLDANYPKEERGNTTKLIIRFYKLLGELDLTDFPQLIELNCSHNQLTGLELSKNLNLIKFWCDDNLLEKLDVSHNTKLVELSIVNNKITDLDLSKNLQLKFCWLESNFFTKLDVSYNTNLTKLHCYDNQLTELDISKNLNLQVCDLANNQFRQLDLLQNKNLNALWCGFNQLTELDISQNISLNFLSCDSNEFRSLDLTKNISLVELDCSDNQLTELDVSQNKELVSLSCDNNKLNKLDLIQQEKLEEFSANDNLELSLVLVSPVSRVAEDRNLVKFKKFEVSGTLFFLNLNLYANSYWDWAEAHFQYWSDKIVNSYESTPPRLITEIPQELINPKSIKENLEFSLVDYDSFLLCDPRPFLWEREKITSLLSEQLPTKLFNLQTEQIELANPSIKNYAILSYVWAGNHDTSTEKLFDRLSAGGKKALVKAQKALEFINQSAHEQINYLWIDQLCIDQRGNVDKSKEVPRMRDYYAQAEVTLVSINCSLESYNKNDIKEKYNFALGALKTIVNSAWFERTWTFQEGWLSKRTVFMFDDCLVDGRMMAQLLASYVKELDHAKALNAPRQYLTPLGSSYSPYPQSQYLGLWNALYLVRDRGRTIKADSLYGILGLIDTKGKNLVDYKPNNCSQCGGEEQPNCTHQKLPSDWVTYSEEELHERLVKTVQILDSLYLFSSFEVFEQFFVKKNLFFRGDKLILENSADLVNIGILDDYRLSENLLEELKSSIEIKDRLIKPFQVSGWSYQVAGQGKKCVLYIPNEKKEIEYSLAITLLEGSELTEQDLIIVPSQDFQLFSDEYGTDNYSFLAFRFSKQKNVFHFLKLAIRGEHCYQYFQEMRGEIQEIKIDLMKNQLEIVANSSSLSGNNYQTLQAYWENKYVGKLDEVKKLAVDSITESGWVKEIKSGFGNSLISPPNEKEFKQLRGKTLDLSVFPNLESLVVWSHYLRETIVSLKINCHWLWGLYLSGSGFPLSLQVDDWSSLIYLTINHCQLVSLDLSACFKLEQLDCSHNLLERIVFNGENEQLSKVFCKFNKVSDLSCLLPLNTKKLLEFKLDDNLVDQLKTHLRPEEKFLENVATDKLLVDSNEVNCVILFERWKEGL